MTTLDLFQDDAGDSPGHEPLGPGAALLRRFCLDADDALLSAIGHVAASAPFRHMVTPGGYRMSAAMTNCGVAGWVTDRTGYRYDAFDPVSGKRWPAMPKAFVALAAGAASAAGFAGFAPDVCLINRYEPGAKLSLHQDKDERRFDAPIVSVSLGLPATFLFGGMKRNDRQRKVALRHGDVVVWGGPSRLAFHGVAPLRDGEHRTVGRLRLNLTFRKAL
jgi:alkylated DNA repair protein (DNA oxidative demethylase)